MATEFRDAVVLANLVLDRHSADPDDDLAILARQFLRSIERNEKIKSFLLIVACDGANRVYLERNARELIAWLDSLEEVRQ
jgi:hypothetical protein